MWLLLFVSGPIPLNMCMAAINCCNASRKKRRPVET